VIPVRLPIVHHVLTETAIPVHQVIVQRVVHTVTVQSVATIVVQVPIVHPVHTVIDQNVVMIVALQVIVQPVVRTEIVTRVHRHVQVPIVANAVTVQEIHDHLQIVPIVRHVLMVIDQNAVMIVVQVPIDQQVVRMVIAIPVQVPVHLPIVVTDQQVVHTETETHAHLPIVHVVARRVDRQIDAMTVILDRAIHDPRQINPAEATHTVVIAHAQVMIAMPVRLRVTANAVADQIVPAVVSPMIAKSVHAVALAKSA
jgi:hypothetical protein